MVNYLKDLKLVYTRSLEETFIRIRKNPLVLILPLIFSLLLSIVNRVFGSFVSIGNLYVSFLTPVLYALILSVYLEMLSDVMYYNRLHIRNINSSFRNYFGAVYSVYFVLILANWVTLAVIGRNYMLNLVFWSIVFVIFNPIIETIYLKDESYISAYSYCLNFMKENFIHWIIPLSIYLVVQNLLGYSILDLITDDAIIALPIGRKFSLNLFNLDIIYFLKYFIVEILTGFYIIFRGNLFKILSTTTKRKREYMGDV